MRFTVNGVTEEEVEALINNEYNNKNNICIYNNKVCINNIHTYLTTNYNIIFYLILNKKFTYRYELNKIKRNDWKYYLDRLEEKGLIKQYTLTQEEDYFMVWKNKTGRHQINKAKYYSLVSEVEQKLNERIYYDILYSSLPEKVKHQVKDYNAKLKLSNIKLNSINKINKIMSYEDCLLSEIEGFEE